MRCVSVFHMSYFDRKILIQKSHLRGWRGQGQGNYWCVVDIYKFVRVIFLVCSMYWKHLLHVCKHIYLLLIIHRLLVYLLFLYNIKNSHCPLVNFFSSWTTIFFLVELFLVEIFLYYCWLYTDITNLLGFHLFPGSKSTYFSRLSRIYFQDRHCLDLCWPMK